MSNLEKKLLEVARGFYGDVEKILEKFKLMNSFELLVGTIISQNTNWKNVEKAMANMRSKGFLTVDGIINADVHELEKALKVAGLYRVKARRLKEVAHKLRDWGLSLDDVLSMRFEEARARLMELPSVGYKTADVLLVFKSGFPLIPIDTHINRIVKRLRLVNDEADYEEIRLRLESFVPPSERALFHLALIKFGRDVCRARDPLCGRCPLSDLCPSRRG